MNTDRARRLNRSPRLDHARRSTLHGTAKPPAQGCNGLQEAAQKTPACAGEFERSGAFREQDQRAFGSRAMSERFSHRVAVRSSRGRALLNFRESAAHTPIEREEGENSTRYFRERIERWKAVLRNDPCAYCGRPATTIDHITPKSLRAAGEWPLWSDYTRGV